MKPPDHDAIDGPVLWAGVDDTYFAMVAVPARPTSGLEYRTVPYEHKTNGKPEERFLITGLVPVPADGSKTEIFVGPKDHRLLDGASKEIASTGGPQIDLGEVINYGFLGSMRRALAVPILWAIDRLQRATGSYGIAIILFTIFIYSLFFPLKWQSSRKMKKAQKYAPRMKELQEQLKGMKQTDPRLKELQMEQLRLMKEANPLGGCLPLLIQMPFLFAYYRMLSTALDLRHAHWLWIHDLSAPDPIYILPILMVISSLVTQRMTPQAGMDPAQQRMMNVMMPLMMGFIFFRLQAGLNLYYAVVNLISIAQQAVMNRTSLGREMREMMAKRARKKDK
jgi:YidC/Oxa1 family membrane protein insertase